MENEEKNNCDKCMNFTNGSCWMGYKDGECDSFYDKYKLVHRAATENAHPSKEMVDHPQHYNGIKGVECIDVVRHMNFNVGNAVKYLWRAGLKSEEGMADKQKQIEDLKKAIWYINDEIKRIEQ